MDEGANRNGQRPVAAVIPQVQQAVVRRAEAEQPPGAKKARQDSAAAAARIIQMKKEAKKKGPSPAFHRRERLFTDLYSGELYHPPYPYIAKQKVPRDFPRAPPSSPDGKRLGVIQEDDIMTFLSKLRI